MTITLPERPAPSGVSVDLIDYGIVQRPALGARTTRIERPGSRYRVQIEFPPMKADLSRIFVSRFLSAKSEGLRVEFPLLDVDQGVPGVPVVNATNPTGKSLPIRGLIPGYGFREGFWLTIFDDRGIGDGSGPAYLHNCRSNVVADESGEATISIEPALRVPFADGCKIELRAPVIEGLVLGDAFSWTIPVNRLVALSIPVEEAG